MKLFYIPGACSLVPHILLRETSAEFELQEVGFIDAHTREPMKLTDPGARSRPYLPVYDGDRDYRAINPKGVVPALQLDSGEVITEGVAIHQYIADRQPELQLIAAPGSLPRYQVLEWLNYISCNLHKGFGQIMHMSADWDLKLQLLEALWPKFDFVAEHLGPRQYLVGERYTVADTYLWSTWTVTGFIRRGDYSRWPGIKDYLARIRSRPATLEALKVEGMLERYTA